MVSILHYILRRTKRQVARKGGKETREEIVRKWREEIFSTKMAGNDPKTVVVDHDHA